MPHGGREVISRTRKDTTYRKWIIENPILTTRGALAPTATHTDGTLAGSESADVRLASGSISFQSQFEKLPPRAETPRDPFVLRFSGIQMRLGKRL
ncbi:core-E1 [Anopheles sinensis]|uniref:Core-E1 n=1 Tax=Anopheles sinensis TaxID=74873 RepID=A0A084VVA4_ANOSI|nr:core-E1 [Anopheles sinensis]